MKEEIQKNHEHYCARMAFYKQFGYDAEWERKNMIERIQPLSEPILEVGTGKGYLTVGLAQTGCTLTSVDVAPEEQNFARMNVKYYGLTNHVQFLIANAARLSFDDKSMATIISVNVIHHLEEPYRVVDEMMRICSDEGKIIISDFNTEGFALMAKIHEEEGKTHGVSPIGLSEVVQYFKERKYKIETFDSVHQEGFIARK